MSCGGVMKVPVAILSPLAQDGEGGAKSDRAIAGSRRKRVANRAMWRRSGKKHRRPRMWHGRPAHVFEEEDGTWASRPCHPGEIAKEHGHGDPEKSRQ